LSNPYERCVISGANLKGDGIYLMQPGSPPSCLYPLITHWGVTVTTFSPKWKTNCVYE